MCYYSKKNIHDNLKINNNYNCANSIKEINKILLHNNKNNNYLKNYQNRVKKFLFNVDVDKNQLNYKTEKISNTRETYMKENSNKIIGNKGIILKGFQPDFLRIENNSNCILSNKNNTNINKTLSNYNKSHRFINKEKNSYNIYNNNFKYNNNVKNNSFILKKNEDPILIIHKKDILGNCNNKIKTKSFTNSNLISNNKTYFTALRDISIKKNTNNKFITTLNNSYKENDNSVLLPNLNNTKLSNYNILKNKSNYSNSNYKINNHNLKISFINNVLDDEINCLDINNYKHTFQLKDTEISNDIIDFNEDFNKKLTTLKSIIYEEFEGKRILSKLFNNIGKNRKYSDFLKKIKDKRSYFNKKNVRNNPILLLKNCNFDENIPYNNKKKETLSNTDALVNSNLSELSKNVLINTKRINLIEDKNKIKKKKEGLLSQTHGLTVKEFEKKFNLK